MDNEEIKIDNVDSKKIIDEIKAQVSKRSYDEESDKKLDAAVLKEEERTNAYETDADNCSSISLKSLRQKSAIVYDWKIEKSDGAFGYSKMVTKRIVKSMNNFIIKTLFEQQNSYNEELVKTIENLNRRIETLEKEITNLKNEK